MVRRAPRGTLEAEGRGAAAAADAAAGVALASALAPAGPGLHDARQCSQQRHARDHCGAQELVAGPSVAKS